MSTPIITIFVRHAPGCKYAGDEFCKRCTCRKHLRYTLEGKQYRKQAGTRSWAEAEASKRILEDQLAGRVPVEAKAGTMTIRAAVNTFLSAKKVREITADAYRRYEIELNRLAGFCENAGVYTTEAIALPVLIAYKATWPEAYPSTTTRAIVQKRLNGFLRFCRDAGYITALPKLDPVKIIEPPTMPLTDAEFTRLLEAVGEEFTNGSAARVRCLILLMRWSGLAVRDAATFDKSKLKHAAGKYSVVTSRQKNGNNVYVPFPTHVAEELLTLPTQRGRFFDSTKGGNDESLAKMRSQEITRVFQKAKIECAGHMVSHRLRDTFAVHYLSRGVPMGEVSKMLGHSNIATTERHYAQWDQSRQDRLETLISSTWE